MKKLILVLAMAALAAVSAHAQKLIAIEHSYSEFSEVEVGDYFSVSYVISDEYSVKITTDTAIEDYIQAYAKGGVLYLSVDEKAMPSEVRKAFKAKNSEIANPEVKIYAPSLSAVTLTGNSSLNCDTVLKTAKFKLSLSRNATVKNLEVNANSVLIDLANKSQTYMTVEAQSLNVQCTNNAYAELKIDVTKLTANTESYASVEMFGKADSIVLSTKGNSTIELTTK